MLMRANVRNVVATCLLIWGPALASAAELSPCPSSPNCVSSGADKGDEHYVAPLAGKGNRQASLDALTAILDSLPRVEWEKISDSEIKATFTSLIFRFTDDVNLIIEPDGSVQVRSASRVGYSDLGANRRRVEQLRIKMSQTTF